MRLRKNTFKQQETYYQEIDEIPLFNWSKCLDGHFQFIRKDGKRYYCGKDVEAFLALFDKYLAHKGFTLEQDMFIKLQQSCISFAAKFIETGDLSYVTHFKVAMAKLAQIDPRKIKGKSITETLVTLSKWVGYWIDSKKITLEDYLNLIASFEDENTKTV